MINHMTASLFLLITLLAAHSVAGGLNSEANTPWNSDTNAKNSRLDNTTTFLPVDDAFSFSLNNDGDAATLVWIIAPEHYLYRHAFSVAIDIPKMDGSIEQVVLTPETRFSQGIKTTDDYFGPVEVYYYQATAQLPMDSITRLQKRSDFTEKDAQLSIQYQGCAEAGLCYPVQTRQISLP